MDKQSPKAFFNLTYWVTFIGLSLLIPLGLVLTNHWLFRGRLIPGGYSGVLIVPSMFLSSVIATLVCRHKGISLDSRSVEIIRRGENEPRPNSPSVFEMRHDKRQWLTLFWLLLSFSLLVLPLVILLPAVPGTKIYGYLLVGGCLLAAGGCWLAYHYNLGFIARADASGITGANGLAVTARSVPWSKIESCEVTILHDVFGSLTHPSFIFKDSQGQVLLKMLTAGTPEAQTTTFRAAIQHHLSKPAPISHQEAA